MIDLAKEAILKGRDIILDATFREKAYREAVMRELNFADIYWLWCVADDSVVRERFMKRKESEDISDARWEIYLAQKEKFEAPDEVDPQKLIKLDTSEGTDLIGRVIERVYGVES